MGFPVVTCNKASAGKHINYVKYYYWKLMKERVPGKY